MEEKFRLIERKCGGWLAISHRWADIRIGVEADSEDAAREKYLAAVSEWRKMLAADAEKRANFAPIPV